MYMATACARLLAPRNQLIGVFGNRSPKDGFVAACAPDVPTPVQLIPVCLLVQWVPLLAAPCWVWAPRRIGNTTLTAAHGSVCLAASVAAALQTWMQGCVNGLGYCIYSIEFFLASQPQPSHGPRELRGKARVQEAPASFMRAAARLCGLTGRYNICIGWAVRLLRCVVPAPSDDAPPSAGHVLPPCSLAPFFFPSQAMGNSFVLRVQLHQRSSPTPRKRAKQRRRRRRNTLHSKRVHSQ